MPEKKKNVENQYILEIRFRPNPRMLDKRGEWAEFLLQQMDVINWRIDKDRIDVFSETGDIRAFISFRNTGLIIYDAPAVDYFANLCSKLINFVFSLEEFGNSFTIERVGARGTFCFPYEGSFDELVNRYSTRFINLTDKGNDAVGNEAKIVDIGSPINFSDKDGKVNIMGGPMMKNQFPQLFERNEIFPDVGLFLDMDHWLEPKRKLDKGELDGIIRNFGTLIWNRKARISKLILEG